MPFDRPTLTELKTQVASDISTNVPGSNGFLRFGNLPAVGKALAAMGNGNYGYLDWIALQATPFTATDEFLEAWAALKGVTRKPAVGWQGTVSFPAASGSAIPEGVPIVWNTGVQTLQYVSTAAVNAGESDAVIVPAEAVLAPTDLYGSLTNVQNGTPVTLGGGVVGISSNGTIVSTTEPGVDVETDDSLRSRMLAAFATPPAGGAPTDYVGWAEDVPGVTRAWCWRNGMGPGTVVVYIMADSTTAPGFPIGANGVASGETRDTAATGLQLVVANFIFALQPATPLVYVVSPPQNQINFTITGLSTAGGTVQSNVEAAINTVLLAQGDQGGVVDLGAVSAAIQAVAGAAAAVVTAVSCTDGFVPSPFGNITSNPSAVPCLGAVTFA
jgi:uncharacterized phage protein gp47/JayE